MTAFTYRTQPLGKQAEVIEKHWVHASHALLCRPGTGKSKMALDHAGHLYCADKLTALVIIAPNGVHKQWVDSAIPTHMSPSVPYTGGAYTTGIGKRALDLLKRKLATRDKTLRILSMSFEGLQTPTGAKLAAELLREHGPSAMVVVDESHRASNTKSAVHKAVRKTAHAARYRRIATGTLLRQNPFSAYGQFELLGHNLLGFTTLAAFKSMYAEMLPPTHGLVKKLAADFFERTKKKITPQIQAKDSEDKPIYKNLAYLRKTLDPWSSFMTLADVSGIEPVIMASTRYVALTTPQRLIYDSLVEHGIAEMLDGGVLTADGTLALATRLAQVAGGYCPNDDDPLAAPVDVANPKLDELRIVLEELGTEKVVIWAKFAAELSAIATMLADAYGTESIVEYHGRVSNAVREENKLRFVQDPRCRYFVGQQKAGGTGLDGLQAVAQYMVFYSNDYGYLDREQAVARLARTGGNSVVNIIDLMATETIDMDIVKCMQSAEDVHDAVLRRAITRKWI
jgi:hypothetical protein